MRRLYDRHQHLIGQFVRYGIVGVFNVAFFLALFNLLRVLGLHAVLAYVCAFVPTNVTSFLLNKRWAFRDTRRDGVHIQYALFAAFTIVALGINTGAFTLFLIPLKRYGDVGHNIAALLPLPLSVAWNFTAYRRWTFHATPARAPSAGSAAASRARR